MASLNSFFPQIDQYDPKPMMEQNRQNALLDLQQKTFGMQQNKFAQEQADAANARKQEAAMKIGQAALTIQTEPEFNALRDFAVQNGFPEAAQYTFQQLPQIRAMFQQSGAFTGDSFQAQQANALVAREVASGVPIEQAKANVAAKMLERVVPISAGGGVYAYDRFASGGGNSTAQPNQQIQVNTGAGLDGSNMTLDQINAGLLGTKAGQALNRSAPSSMTPLITPRTPEQQIEQKAAEAAAVERAKAMAGNEATLDISNEKRLPAIQEARSILTASDVNATESNLGALRNTIQKETGLDTASSQRERETNARLSVLGGFLTSSVPRMEGPQSDKDTAMYREMAGKIADPTATISERLSALDTLERITKAYSGGQPTAQPPAAPVATGNIVRWEDLP